MTSAKVPTRLNDRYSKSMTSAKDVCKHRNRGMHDRREGMPGRHTVMEWHPAGCGIRVRIYGIREYDIRLRMSVNS